MVSPLAFIPMAEEHGLIDPLTQQVFQLALRQAGTWKLRGHHIKLTFNLFMDSLVDISLPDRLLQWVAEAGLEPVRVTLELTESRLMDQPRATLEVLTRLRLNGFGLSIDDFGTGHSSLDKLKLLPFTELKVDRAFVHGASLDPVSSVILKTSVHIAHSLGMTVVAEGVETEDDIAYATELGCDELQGYGVARPMTADALARWLEAQA